MNTLKEKLEHAIEKSLLKEDYQSAAELTKAIAAIRSTEAQERNAASIEKALAAIAGIGEAATKAAMQFDPAALEKMMRQGKET